MAQRAVLKQTKSKALHNTWEAEVFEKANEEIAQEVDARSSRTISDRGAKLIQEVQLNTKHGPKWSQTYL